MSTEMIERDIADFFAEDRRHFLKDCRLICPESTIGKIRFSMPPDKRLREGYRVELTHQTFRGRVHIGLGPGTGHVRIDTGGTVNLDIRMFRESSFFLDRGTTINAARVICDQSDVVVGRDGLWSDEIIIQSNDQHGIVDLDTGEVCNGGRRRVEIGDHVWIGRRTTIMPDTRMGRGSILATGAVLTSDVPPNTVFAGVPARQIRENVTWSRAPEGFSNMERNVLDIKEGWPETGSAELKEQDLT